MSELSVIGKPIQKIDAVQMVTGRARYCVDFKVPGMLHAKLLRSPYPHAKITRIDTSKARNLPGVRLVLTGKDAPPKRFGLILRDQCILARDKRVRFVGEPVAAVAADTLEIAEEALKLIEVDYEELPAIFDPEESLEPNPRTVIHPDFSDYPSPGALFGIAQKGERAPNIAQHCFLYHGDIDKGFSEADFIVENRYTTARICHVPMEVHNAVAWVEADGTLVVHTSTQGPWMVHEVLEQVFDLAPAKLRIMSSKVGGGYGGKQSVVIEPLCALLALKSGGRPVSLVFTREEQFNYARQRVTVISYIKDGVKSDGTVVAREMKIIVDLGAYGDIAVGIAMIPYFSAMANYRIPNVKVESYGVYTNLPLTGPFRGYGVPEIIWGLEQQMDIIAEKAGIDPVELRKKHILEEGELNPSGEVTHGNNVGACLDKVVEWIKWAEKPKQEVGPWRRGKGIAIGNKYTAILMQSFATVRIHRDGTIEVRHGTGEMGQGIDTVAAQIVAEEFGTSVDRVKVVRGDTAFTPYDYTAVSSRSTFWTGHAVQRACWDAKQKLLDLASSVLELPSADLRIKDGTIYAPDAPGKSTKISDLFFSTGITCKTLGEVRGTGFYAVPNYARDKDTGKTQKAVSYYSATAHGVEVAVNIETGQVKVLRIIGAFDCGTPINPKMAEGQIEGGILMGISSALHEEVVLERGVMLNPNFVDYKLISPIDMPSNENMKGVVVGIPYDRGPFGAKGLGEGVLVTVAPAIANAIYDAVGVRVDSLPITQQKLWKKLREKAV
jgi:CO/xanthine dehydrogenase Mo-binding subunit